MLKITVLHKFLFFLLFILGFSISNAQISAIDSTVNTVVAVHNAQVVSKTDSIIKIAIINTYKNNKYYNVNRIATKPDYSLKKQEKGNDTYFYAVAALLLSFGLLRTVFNKYYTDFFSFTFKTTLKKNQLKQQLLQDNLPSLLFNLLFIVSISFYIFLLITKYYNYHYKNSWIILGYLITGVLTIYLLKFLQLKFIGWLLKINPVTNSYIFLIFYVNKALAIFLLPFILILSLTHSGHLFIFWTLSWVLIGIMLLYRLIMTLRLYIQFQKNSVLNYIIYSMALEILPFLILAKAIAVYLK